MVVDLVNYSSPHFGMRIGFAGEMELVGDTCNDNTTICMRNAGYEGNPYAGSAYTTLALGPIHFGTQATFEDLGATAITGIANTRSIVGGIAFVVADTISFSYGKGYEKIRYNDATERTFRIFASSRSTKLNPVVKGIHWVEEKRQVSLNMRTVDYSGILCSNKYGSCSA